ncbi:MAG: hypothetical protein ACYC61_11940 [Isosphaeraceae bacterium]
MTTTIAVDPELLSQRSRETIRGVEVDVFPSPYDVPRSILVENRFGAHDAPAIVLSFAYLAPEEPSETLHAPTPEKVVVRIGRKTRRINRVEFLIERLGGRGAGFKSRCLAALHEAVTDLQRSTDPSHALNYSIIVRLIDQWGPRFFGSK